MKEQTGWKQLSKAQQNAVFHRFGAAIVLAGPGSGKTSVIIARTSLAVREWTSAGRFLCVTFSNKASEEMAARFRHQFPAQEAPVFCTVHSLCNRILLEYENSTGCHYRRMEGESGEKYRMLREIYRKWHKEEPDKAQIERLTGWIGRMRSRTDSGLSIDFEPQMKYFNEIYHEYQIRKQQERMLDFDDMVFMAREVLCDREAMQIDWRSRYDYIQVDEAQDLSRAQFDVLRYLCGNGNLFIVADDDQSIYGFRGADPTCVLHFSAYYPDCAMFYLEENYRSARRIVSAASTIVSYNTVRYHKHLFTKNEAGISPQFAQCRSGYEQAVYLKELFGKMQPDKSAGILYRNNLSSLLLRLYFTKRNIPFDVSDPGESAFSYWMVREVLRRIQTEEKTAAFLLPSPAQVLQKMMQEGFTKKCRIYYERLGQQKRFIECMIEFLLCLCSLCHSYEECVLLLEKMEEKKSGGNVSVHLSTVHSAKGLEYDAVFIVDLVKDEFPGNGVSGMLLEEERRLFYVAMTRAKERLYLLRPERRGGQPEEPSIFWLEAKKAIGKK